MKKSFLFNCLLVLTIFLSASCVSKKKYHAALDHADRLHDDSLNTHAKLGQCNAALAGLQNEKGTLQSEKSELEKQNEDAINELNRVSSTSKMTIAQQAQRLANLQNLLNSHRPNLIHWNADRRHGRAHILEYFDIIKTGNTHLFWHGDAFLFQAEQATQSLAIIGSKNCRDPWLPVYKLVGSLKTTFEGKIAFNHQGWVVGYLESLESALVTGQPPLAGDHPGWTQNKADRAVTQLDEIFRHILGGLHVVNADLRYAQISIPQGDDRNTALL